MIMVTLSLEFLILYRRQFGARVSPLHVGVVSPVAQFGACFLPSFRVTPSGRALLHGHRHGAGQQQLSSAVLPHGRRLWEGGCVFWGVGAFSPPP